MDAALFLLGFAVVLSLPIVLADLFGEPTSDYDRWGKK